MARLPVLLRFREFGDRPPEEPFDRLLSAERRVVSQVDAAGARALLRPVLRDRESGTPPRCGSRATRLCNATTPSHRRMPSPQRIDRVVSGRRDSQRTRFIETDLRHLFRHAQVDDRGDALGLQVAQRLLGRLATDEQVAAEAGELGLEEPRDIESDGVRR